MSHVTEGGRRRKRDQQLERLNRTLREDANLSGIPMYLLTSFAELKLVGRNLYAHIKTGVSCVVMTKLIRLLRRTGRILTSSCASWTR
jgi:hypothetical protein